MAKNKLMDLLDEKGMGGGEEGGDRESTHDSEDESSEVSEGAKAAYAEFKKAVHSDDDESGMRNLQAFVKLANRRDSKAEKDDDSEQDTGGEK